jgi:hypothetical protein
VWTFRMREGKCAVVAQAANQPDTIITSDIATYMKTAVYGMQSPLVALLTGKTRIQGLGKARQFQSLLAATPTRIWQPLERGRVGEG